MYRSARGAENDLCKRGELGTTVRATQDEAASAALPSGGASVENETRTTHLALLTKAHAARRFAPRSCRKLLGAHEAESAAPAKGKPSRYFIL
eukprot:2697614-Pleurochrysis_carterae.AAC.2